MHPAAGWDRPSRDVGATSTPRFLQNLGFREDNPPNATMILEIAPGETDTAVVELFNPAFLQFAVGRAYPYGKSTSLRGFHITGDVRAIGRQWSRAVPQLPRIPPVPSRSHRSYTAAGGTASCHLARSRLKGDSWCDR